MECVSSVTGSRSIRTRHWWSGSGTGRKAAVTALVAAHGDRVYRLAIQLTGNSSDAEEVMQDAFWSATRRIDSFRGTAAFLSWLYRITLDSAYQKLRGRRREGNAVTLGSLRRRLPC